MGVTRPLLCITRSAGSGEGWPWLATRTESGGAHRLRWPWRAVLRMKPLLLRQTRNLTATLK